mgnify:CR=1 FL=1
MSYNVSFISLGCAKNQVNCEQMMALCAEAGYSIQAEPAGCDVVVVNTCGFLASACEEAIENILEMAELKKEGKIKKILVTGCMTQRYKEDIFHELPEVDGLLGTGSYGDIATAIAEVMEKGTKPCHLGNIHTANQSGERILSTPPWYAYLRIAEGCDNHCAFCVIPQLRGKYRSRKFEDLIDEAKILAANGVKELILIAQDTSRYGIDLYGKRRLSELLRELCKIDGFHWIRIHYLYPDEMDEDLIDTIAQEEKICSYLDIPIQHCNDKILRTMNRRGNKEYLDWLLPHLREKIPGLVLRTSLIAGLPGEGEEEFQELCEFLKKHRMERVGCFVFSPEEGTVAAKMEYPEQEIAEKRAEIVSELQSRIMDDYNESLVGKTIEVLVEGYDRLAECQFGRTYADSPEIDGMVFFNAETRYKPGSFVNVTIEETMDGNLIGTAVEAAE